MKLLVYDFPFRGPWGRAFTDAMQPLARDIAAEPGLLWKLWTENPVEGRAGGVYAFASDAARDAYERKHTARLAARGVRDVTVWRRDVNQALSAVTRAPVRGDAEEPAGA